MKLALIATAVGALVAVIFVFSLGPVQAPIPVLKEDAWPSESISMVALIANPSHHDGRKVSVQGYVHIDEVGKSAVFLHQEDAAHSISSNGLALEWDRGAPQELIKNYSGQSGFASVFGYFRAPQPGVLDIWSGRISVITVVFPTANNKPNQPAHTNPGLRPSVSDH